MIEYRILPLSEIIQREDTDRLVEKAIENFECRREVDLESFLLYKAVVYEKISYGKTYLIIDKKKRRKLLGNYPGRDTLSHIPVYLIGQLGRSDKYSSKDLSGQQILNECYNVIGNAIKIIGGSLIVLECREDMFLKFYEKQGYKKLYDVLSDEGTYILYKKIDF